MYEFFSCNPFLLKVFLFFQGIYLDNVGLVKNANPYVVIICLASSVLLIYFIDRYPLKKGSIIHALFAGLYLTFLLSVTLFGREPVLTSSWDGLFHTYNEAFNGNVGMQLDILFNIFLYVPVGFLLSRYNRDVGIIIFIFALTVIIELIQLVTSLGIFELSDIINNLIGGIIGLGIARLTAGLYKIILDKRKGGSVERAQ